MGTVHVVATPIGNLEDITLRAIRVLREADLIFAEDTRRTRVLLEHQQIAARPLSLGTHNEAARTRQALERLRDGASIALVSDAGTPLVSDPGSHLVAAAVEDGHRVEAIPGASAVLAALSVCGLRVQPFTFIGFLPRKPGARRKLLEPYRGRRETLVLFESPRRVGPTLKELAELFGGARRACVARELTKLHEEVVTGTLADLAKQFSEDGRGEFTLVVEGAAQEEAAAAASPEPELDIDLDDEIRALVGEGRRPREIAALLASKGGVPRREIYARAVAAKGRAAEEVGSQDLAEEDAGAKEADVKPGAEDEASALAGEVSRS